MNTKKLIVLLLVAAALVAAAVFSSKKDTDLSGASGEPPMSVVLSDLPVNDIQRITLTTADDALDLQRKETGWVSPSKYGYPARFDNIKKTLIKLSELKAGDKRNMTEEEKAKVRMLSPRDEAAQASGRAATLIEMFTDKEQPAAALLIGGDRIRKVNGRTIPEGKFLSADGGKTVMVSTDFLAEFDRINVETWIDAMIVSVGSFSITNIVIDVYDEKPVHLHTEDGGAELTLDKLRRKEKMNSSSTRSVRYALSYLRFEDIADPGLDDKAMGFDKASTFTATTDKGEVYTLTIGGSPENSSQRYVRCTAEYIGVPEPKGEEGSPELTRKLDEIKNAKQRVEDTSKRTRGWTYLISSTAADPMMWPREKFISEKDD